MSLSGPLPDSQRQLPQISVDIEESLIPNGEEQPQIDSARDAQLRLAFAMSGHLIGFISKWSALVAFVYLKQCMIFLFLLLVMLLLSLFCTVAAMRDEQVKRFLPCLPCILRLPVVFVVFGVFQFAQVRSILNTHQRRSSADDGVGQPTPKNPKTFDGIIEGIPFAVCCLWVFLLIDNNIGPSDVQCPWFINDNTTDGRIAFRSSDTIYHYCFSVFFAVTGLIALATVGMAILEVDYRVGSQARRRIEKSICSMGMHLMYRTTEAAFSIFNVALFLLFLRPLLALTNFCGQGGGLFRIVSKLCPFSNLCSECPAQTHRKESTSCPVEFLILFLLFILLMCAKIYILSSAAPKDAPREFLLAHIMVAVSSFGCDPALFVDSPGYIAAARRTSRLFSWLNAFQLLLLIAVIVLSFTQDFPENACELNSITPSDGIRNSIGWYYMFSFLDRGKKEGADFTWMPFLTIAVVIARILGWVCNQGLTKGGEHQVTDNAVLEMIPHDDSSEGAVTVRGSVARGFSSHLLRVGVGLVSTLWIQEPPQIGDYVIERVLGRGGYAVVVLVRQRGSSTISHRGSHPGIGGEPSHTRYAMKLMNSHGNPNDHRLPSKKDIANRERENMQILKNPFIVNLIYYFEVPDKVWKDTSDQIISDCSGSTRFHKAIVMEYCPLGDLQQYVLSHALPVGYVHPPERSLDSAEVEWLSRMRRFAAEMASALAFMHKQMVIYRDLKPQNVLLKSGTDKDLHICFTDFGFSKRVGVASMKMDSLAGSPLYMAPEIFEILRGGNRMEYTVAVDLYSLGRTILVMLWRTFLSDEHEDELHMPESRQYWNDPRVPKAAQSMVEQLTTSRPSQRGEAADLRHHAFFRTMRLGEVDSQIVSESVESIDPAGYLVPIDFNDLEKWNPQDPSVSV